MRRLLVVLVAALIAASCSGDDTAVPSDIEDELLGDSTTSTEAPDDTSDTDTGSTTTVAVEPFDSFRGVTADTIELGAISFDSELLASLGLSAVSFGDQNLAYQTFVDEVNARGGIHGRMLNLTAEAYLPTTASEAEPICVRLTEDIGVFAVLGSFLAGSVAANECIVGQHDTIMVGGVHTAAEFDAASAPWVSSLMSIRRMYAAGVQLLDDNGYLDDDPDIGIIAVVDEVDDVEKALVPALEDLGHDPETYVLDIFLGDLIVAGGATDAVRQRMEADGIDLVLLAYSSIIRTPQDLLNAGWDKPIVSLAPNEFMETIDVVSSSTPEESDGVIGMGGLTPDEKFALRSSQRCIEIFEAANPDIEVLPVYQVPPGEPRWIVSVLSACAEVTLFEAIATSAGVDLTNDSFRAAAEALGEIDVPGVHAADLGPGKLDADNAVRLVEWDSTVGSNGGVRSVSDLLVLD